MKNNKKINGAIWRVIYNWSSKSSKSEKVWGCGQDAGISGWRQRGELSGCKQEEQQWVDQNGRELLILNISFSVDCVERTFTKDTTPYIFFNYSRTDAK